MTVVHPRSLAAAVRRMTKANPLVMCVTNRVTAQRVADLTLAAGASPAMIDNPAEVPGFAAISSAVYINAGLHTSQVAALEALKSMSARPKLVLDPVGFGASAYRNQAIQDFLVRSPPNVIKGNSNEICGLVGADASGQGVDSAAGTANAFDAHPCRTAHTLLHPCRTVHTPAAKGVVAAALSHCAPSRTLSHPQARPAPSSPPSPSRGGTGSASSASRATMTWSCRLVVVVVVLVVAVVAVVE